MIPMKILSIEAHEPKRKFYCERCDARGMVSPRGVYRRFEVKMADEVGKPGAYCVVCASILTGRRQGELMRIGREGARP